MSTPSETSASRPCLRPVQHPDPVSSRELISSHFSQSTSPHDYRTCGRSEKQSVAAGTLTWTSSPFLALVLPHPTCAPVGTQKSSKANHSQRDTANRTLTFSNSTDRTGYSKVKRVKHPDLVSGRGLITSHFSQSTSPYDYRTCGRGERQSVTSPGHSTGPARPPSTTCSPPHLLRRWGAQNPTRPTAAEETPTFHRTLHLLNSSTKLDDRSLK